MDKDIKSQWTEALTSGLFKQGKCQLKNGDKYCCLGVLCELHGKKFNSSWYSKEGAEYYEGQQFVIPECVQLWAGLQSRDGTINTNLTLASANDDGQSFESIAELINEFF